MHVLGIAKESRKGKYENCSKIMDRLITYTLQQREIEKEKYLRFFFLKTEKRLMKLLELD